MRKDVTDLKKLVHSMINEDIIDQDSLDSPLVESFRKSTEPSLTNEIVTNPYVLNTSESAYDFDNIEDISHETERDESLSIEAKEKELIIKALRKNNNKRKYAAKDLGISERTLYRKIKQFGIDD